MTIRLTDIEKDFVEGFGFEGELRLDEWWNRSVEEIEEVIDDHKIKLIVKMDWNLGSEFIESIVDNYINTAKMAMYLKDKSIDYFKDKEELDYNIITDNEI